MTGRRLAEIYDYADLRAALNALAEERNLSRETLDQLSGLPAGYTAKLLSHRQIRALGPSSMGPMLGVLGARLELVEDAQAWERIARRNAAPRNTAQIRHAGARQQKRAKGCFNSRKAKQARALQLSKQSPERRRIIARKAARARWGKPIRGRPASRRAQASESKASRPASAQVNDQRPHAEPAED